MKKVFLFIFALSAISCYAADEESVFKLLPWNEYAVSYPLHAAAFNGDVTQESLFETGAPLFDLNNGTPLHMACLGGQLKTTQLLIESNLFSVSAQSVSGNTAFNCAAASGNVQLFRYLLSIEEVRNATERVADAFAMLHRMITLTHRDDPEVLSAQIELWHDLGLEHGLLSN